MATENSNPDDAQAAELADLAQQMVSSAEKSARETAAMRILEVVRDVRRTQAAAPTERPHEWHEAAFDLTQRLDEIDAMTRVACCLDANVPDHYQQLPESALTFYFGVMGRLLDDAKAAAGVVTRTTRQAA